MKSTTKLFTLKWLLLSCVLFAVACKKTRIEEDKQTKNYSSEVLADWIKLDLQLLRSNAAKLNNFVMMHHWVYSSIALYEAVLPGMPEYQTLTGQLSEMPGMPQNRTGKGISLAHHGKYSFG
jgi:hypothetical protein